MSTCSLQINIQIDFKSVKVCTFSSLSFRLRVGPHLPVARVVSLDVDDYGFFVDTDDPVVLVTDDALTDDAVTDDAAIAC